MNTNFEEQLRTRAAALVDELVSLVGADRDAAIDAANEATVAAQRQADERLAKTVAEAEKDAENRALEAEARGLAAGRLEGRREGMAEGRRDGVAEGRRDGTAEGRREGREEARAEFEAAELAAGERLSQAIRDIDAVGSLSEILDRVAVSAGREAARVALFLVAGERLKGWRLAGFGASLDDGTGFELSLEDSGIVGKAVQVGTVMLAESAERGVLPAFVTLPPGRQGLAVPLSMNGQAVAVLYADQGEAVIAPPQVRWRGSIEVMVRHAARSLEAVTAIRAAQALTDRPVLRVAPRADHAPGGTRAFATREGALPASMSR